MTALSFPFKLNQGRYLVESVFADGGGMGVVLAARDKRCANNHVLIKTTRYDGGRHARQFKYTVQEATKHVVATRKILEWEKKILVRFRNEGLNNIPSPNNFFYDKSLMLKAQHQGRTGAYSLPSDLLSAEPYLVMETIHGAPLETTMRDPQWRQHMEVHLLTMCREILTIFIKMHKKIDLGGNPAQFLYQDLKPANILVSADDYFTLIDFGGTTMRLGGRTTEPTAGCITTGYAAPEASRGRESEIDPRFDLYTLGATLWHVVTGHDPRDLPEEFPTLDPGLMRGKGISDEFVRIAAKALHPDPAQRYSMAAAMRKDVMDVLRKRL